MPSADIRTQLYLPADITRELLDSGICTTIYKYFPTGYTVALHGKPLISMGDIQESNDQYLRYSVWHVDQDLVKAFYNYTVDKPTISDNLLARALMVIPTTEARLIYLRDYYERNPD